MRNAHADAKTDTPPSPPSPPQVMCRGDDGKPPTLAAGSNVIWHEAKQDPATGRLQCVRCGRVM